MSLPKFKSSDVSFSLAMSTWASQLDPLLANPANNGIILSNVPLLIGTNTVNHMLGQKLQGWQVILKGGEGTIYDLQAINPIPDKTLQLHASSGVTVSLYVF